MLPAIFEKYEICLNRTKSRLIVDQPNILSAKNENFAMERGFAV